MENEDHPESQSHEVFIILSFFSLVFLQSGSGSVHNAKYLRSQSRQIQRSCITYSEIPFLLNTTLTPPSLLDPANIFFSNELWVCCHCPRAECYSHKKKNKKTCWERIDGVEPIHSKTALLGSGVISCGPWDGVPKKRKVSRMWKARKGKGV